MAPSVIIAMAGQGQRFAQAGFSTPKHLIVARQRPLMDWALTSLQAFFATWRFVFVSRRGSISGEQIRAKCQALGIRDHAVVELTVPTSGQAETVMRAKPAVDLDQPILIYNIDTYVEPGQILPIDFAAYGGFLHVFEAPGEHWSFIRLDDQGRVVEVTEKRRVSNLCSIGAYYFSEFSLYDQLYADYVENARTELFVAPVYNHLLETRPDSVGFKLIEESRVHVLGTPQEVEVFDSEFRSWNA
jgi:NDP-sugar pyrophosphorylase family protein